MTTEESKSDSEGSSILLSRDTTNVTLEDFEFIRQLGKGSFGIVFLAKLRINGEHYAIKVLRKDVLIMKGQIERTFLEKEVLFYILEIRRF